MLSDAVVEPVDEAVVFVVVLAVEGREAEALVLEGVVDWDVDMGPDVWTAALQEVADPWLDLVVIVMSPSSSSFPSNPAAEGVATAVATAPPPIVTDPPIPPPTPKLPPTPPPIPPPTLPPALAPAVNPAMKLGL